jgi:hypothetical protein
MERLEFVRLTREASPAGAAGTRWELDLMTKIAARTATALATFAAAVTALTLIPAGAYAASATFTDETGDIRPGIDIRSVAVRNGSDTVKVVITHKNLLRHPRGGAGGTIWFDVDPEDAGPEYAFVAGLFEGTDYTLLSVEGWSLRRNAEPVDCDYSMRLRYAQDKSVVRMARACYGDQDRLRFEVRTSGQRVDGTEVTDWLGRAHQFTRWVAAA